MWKTPQARPLRRSSRECSGSPVNRYTEQVALTSTECTHSKRSLIRVAWIRKRAGIRRTIVYGRNLDMNRSVEDHGGNGCPCSWCRWRRSLNATFKRSPAKGLPGIETEKRQSSGHRTIWHGVRCKERIRIYWRMSDWFAWELSEVRLMYLRFPMQKSTARNEKESGRTAYF